MQIQPGYSIPAGGSFFWLLIFLIDVYAVEAAALVVHHWKFCLALFICVGILVLKLRVILALRKENKSRV